MFRLTPAKVFATLYSFTASDDDGISGDGALPNANVIEGSDGNFYGTAVSGGPGGTGAIFKLTTAGVFTALHEFTAVDDFGNNSDGANPRAALLQGSDGNFYGVTFRGGTSAAGAGTTNGDPARGTLFKITPAGVLTTLDDFDAVNKGGATPRADLAQGSNGNFYGTTYFGGPGGGGTAFEITPAGVLTSLRGFGYLSGDLPDGSLLPAADGNIYGTTPYGGRHENGTIFKLTSAGVQTTLHAFGPKDANGSNSDGAQPSGGLVQGKDGDFYGTAFNGGTGGNGTVFKITAAGKFTTIHHFSAFPEGNYGRNGDGSEPAASLILGSDGNFYGTASRGGAGAYGTAFKITPAGALTTLHSFAATDGSDGGIPRGRLAEGNDGNLYGTASTGGANGTGVVFKVTLRGVFTTLHSFGAWGDTGIDNADGAVIDGGLFKGSDGNFYGTAEVGGVNGAGTVFKVTPAGVFTVLHAFTATDSDGANTDGAYPAAGVIQGSDGNFYGTTSNGGAAGAGTAFVLGYAPVITSAATASGTEGKAFSYQIAATHNPTSFGVAGLKAGLTVNSKTGLISGTPTASGKVTFTLSATNNVGSGKSTLTVTIAANAPVITSAATAMATVGQPFSYQITATNQPTSYGVLGLPPGLKVAAKTGLLSGTPTKTGTFTLTLKATKGAGSGSAMLTLTVRNQ